MKDAVPAQTAEQALSACYDDMRRLARGIVRGDAMRGVYQPTELVNEAAVRLIQSADLAVESRGHMLALAARTMRRVLIDESRRVAAGKRQRPEIMTLFPGSPPTEPIDVEALDRALAALAEVSPDHARIVELRFSLGLTVEQTSAATGVPERTVKRRWQAARAWLLDHLAGGDAARP